MQLPGRNTHAAHQPTTPSPLSNRPRPAGNATYSHTYASGTASNAAAGLRGSMTSPAMMGFGGVGNPMAWMGPGGGAVYGGAAAAAPAAAPARPAGHAFRGRFAMLMCKVTLGRIEVGGLLRVGEMGLAVWTVHAGAAGATAGGTPPSRHPTHHTLPFHIHAPQLGRPQMRICNRGFHGVSSTGAATVARSPNDIYAVYDNAQCYPAFIVHYDMNP
jgi:hypothetical protein